MDSSVDAGVGKHRATIFFSCRSVLSPFAPQPADARPAYTVAEKPRPHQAGQPISSDGATRHTAGARAALLTGKLQAAQQHVINGTARGFLRSIGLRARQIGDFGPVRLWSCSVESEPDSVLCFRFCYAIVPGCITHTLALPPYSRKQRRPSAARQRAGKVA